MTATALAQKAGVSKAAVSRWLAGERAVCRDGGQLLHATGGQVDVAATIRRPHRSARRETGAAAVGGRGAGASPPTPPR